MKVYKILIGMLLFFCSIGCELVENPRYTLSSEIVFSSEENIQNALNGIYVYMERSNYFGGRFFEGSEMGSGLGFAPKAAAVGAPIAGLDLEPTLAFTRSIWSTGFAAIGQINLFLANLESSPLEQAVKDPFIGKGKFLRAINYLELSGLWGGLPIFTKATQTIEDAYVSRSTKDEVYDQIEKDLLEAIDLLQPDINYGQINQWAARALLAKVYFLRASQEDGISGTSSLYWQMAKDQGEIVIEQGPYELEVSFEKLWDGFSPSPEHIFTLYFTLNQDPNANTLSRAFAPPASNQNGLLWARNRATKEVFDFYSTKYPGDPRIDATFFHTSYLRYLANSGSWASTPLYPEVIDHNARGWPYVRKNFDPDQSAKYSSKDILLFRYADLLLLMAEVENELGNSGLAQNYVNQVLERARNADGANSPEPADWPVLGKEEFRKEIYLERQFELYGEGKSYVDVRRRGIEWFGEVLQRHNNNPNNMPDRHPNLSDYTYDVSVDNLTKNLLWPLPDEEINFNDSISFEDQNPGY